MVTSLFWVALVMSLASFGLFALTVIAAIKAAAAGSAGRGGAELEGTTTLPDPIKLAEAFAKAGPGATAAAMSIFFMFVALVVSGVVELSVETKTDATTASAGLAQP